MKDCRECKAKNSIIADKITSSGKALYRVSCKSCKHVFRVTDKIHETPKEKEDK